MQEIREFIDLKVLPAMRREHPDALVELEKLASAPGLNPEEQAAITKLVREMLTRARTGEGRRVLLMAPVHHHFEKAGWAETKVVVRFWILGIVFAMVAFATLKIR
mgnify:CR=1 FL=1